tara:strand:+ start:924 stop:1481 length:558 start_codon:yes stop_codon:yes gene_type:complete
MKTKKVIVALFLMSMLTTACSKEDPVIPNEEEVITTLEYTLTPIDGGTAVVMRFEDLDGDGGNAPIITGGTLYSNETYTAELVLSNEQESPAEDITVEIKDEDEDHQFFFQSTVTGLTVAYNDLDSNEKPVGIESTITTTAVGNGTLKVILRHEPNKSAIGVSTGDITNAGGETDIEVTFDITVQ